MATTQNAITAHIGHWLATCQPMKAPQIMATTVGQRIIPYRTSRVETGSTQPPRAASRANGRMAALVATTHAARTTPEPAKRLAQERPHGLTLSKKTPHRPATQGCESSRRTSVDRCGVGHVIRLQRQGNAGRGH